MPTSRPPETPRTDDPRCHVSVGGLRLKNPLICGSGEHTITAAGMQALLQAGAAAVVAKSVNESEAARKQLDGTDYVLLDAAWKPLPWDFSPPPDAQLFCRSGLFPGRFEDWLTMVAELDRQAAASDAYVIPSLILADLDACIDYALRIEAAGLRVLELNIGAPHGPEAARGAIVTERAASRVLEITRRMRAAIGIPLWIKLTGQSEDVVALAQAAQQGGADAVIMMGRFLGMVPDIDTQAPLLGTSAALGGPWALALTARWLAMTRKAAGPELPLIATNGARSGEDIVRFLLAGACAVEMTSAVMAGGAGPAGLSQTGLVAGAVGRAAGVRAGTHSGRLAATTAAARTLRRSGQAAGGGRAHRAGAGRLVRQRRRAVDVLSQRCRQPAQPAAENGRDHCQPAALAE